MQSLHVWNLKQFWCHPSKAIVLAQSFVPNLPMIEVVTRAKPLPLKIHSMMRCREFDERFQTSNCFGQTSDTIIGSNGCRACKIEPKGSYIHIERLHQCLGVGYVCRSKSHCRFHISRTLIWPPGFSLQATTSSTPGASDVCSCRNASSADLTVPNTFCPPFPHPITSNARRTLHSRQRIMIRNPYCSSSVVRWGCPHSHKTSTSPSWILVRVIQKPPGLDSPRSNDCQNNSCTCSF